MHYALAEQTTDDFGRALGCTWARGRRSTRDMLVGLSPVPSDLPWHSRHVASCEITTRLSCAVYMSRRFEESIFTLRFTTLSSSGSPSS